MSLQRSNWSWRIREGHVVTDETQSQRACPRHRFQRSLFPSVQTKGGISGTTCGALRLVGLFLEFWPLQTRPGFYSSSSCRGESATFGFFQPGIVSPWIKDVWWCLMVWALTAGGVPTASGYTCRFRFVCPRRRDAVWLSGKYSPAPPGLIIAKQTETHLRKSPAGFHTRNSSDMRCECSLLVPLLDGRLLHMFHFLARGKRLRSNNTTSSFVL